METYIDFYDQAVKAAFTKKQDSIDTRRDKINTLRTGLKNRILSELANKNNWTEHGCLVHFGYDEDDTKLGVSMMELVKGALKSVEHPNCELDCSLPENLLSATREAICERSVDKHAAEPWNKHQIIVTIKQKKVPKKVFKPTGGPKTKKQKVQTTVVD